MTTSQKPALLVANTGSGPRIYLACLAAYNNGRLHGAWVDADQGDEHIWNELRKMLKASPDPHAEEWAIHDYEGFADAHLSEHAGFDTVCALAEFISERGDLGGKVHEHFAGDLEQAKSAFEDYAGVFSSVAEFAEQLHEDIGTEIPDSLKHHIDWQSLGHDLNLGGDIFTIETRFDQIHIFWSR